MLWARDLPNQSLAPGLAASVSLVVVEGGGIRRRGRISAFDADGGERVWSTELRRVDAYGIQALLVRAGDAVYTAGYRRSGEAFVSALALRNGAHRGMTTYAGAWSFTHWVALAGDPHGRRIFVTGGSIEGTNGLTEAHVATAAYRAWA